MRVQAEGRGFTLWEGSRRLAYEVTEEAARALAGERLRALIRGARVHAALVLAHAATGFALLSHAEETWGRAALALALLSLLRSVTLWRRSTT